MNGGYRGGWGMGGLEEEWGLLGGRGISSQVIKSYSKVAKKFLSFSLLLTESGKKEKKKKEKKNGRINFLSHKESR